MDLMKIKITGEPDDLIKRCKKCKYCIFEEILTLEQRKIKVLDQKNPKKHIHRMVIEDICGRRYDNVCPMKYAAMKAYCDDRTAMQIGVIKHYMWDLGKEFKKRVEYDQALKTWSKSRDLGRGFKESLAKRYEEIWDRGLRVSIEDEQVEEKQIFTSDSIYEFVIATPKTYNRIIKLLDTLIKEHEKRDSI